MAQFGTCLTSVLLQAPPLSLYVHLPWCVRKCPYCDFNSHAAPRTLPQSDYVAALLADLELDLQRVPGRELISIFFGGGTPSLFDPRAIERVIAGARQRMPCAAALEITLEANPGTIERGRFSEFRAAGITRVSLGAQSFDPLQLRSLGRIHQSDEIFDAVADLVSAGLDNFNLDLMYGLPQQSVAQALADVSAAVALAPRHLSHYQLTLEPGTVFHHRPPVGLPDDNETWQMQVQCQQLLAQHGYVQYEVSAYARGGKQCLHNLNYWQFGDYLGVGAGAHGKLTDPATSSIVRTTRLRQPREYLQRAPQARLEQQVVEPQQRPFEFMLNALRLTQGFYVADFESRTGLGCAAISDELTAACSKGLLVSQDGQQYRASDLGARFLNDLIALFLP